MATSSATSLNYDSNGHTPVTTAAAPIERVSVEKYIRVCVFPIIRSLIYNIYLYINFLKIGDVIF